MRDEYAECYEVLSFRFVWVSPQHPHGCHLRAGCVCGVWEACESYVAVGVVNVEANVATRHDILVYLLESNVERNFATSM